MAPDLTFTGLDEVRQLVDEHCNALGYAALLHVLNRADRKPVVRINLTNSELEPFLDPSQAGAPSPAQLCEALLRRVPVEVERHWSEPGDRAYTLRLHQPKGGYLASRYFRAHRASPPALTVLAPMVVQLHPDLLPEARVWRALGGAVEDFVGTVIRAVTGLLDAEHRVAEHLAQRPAKCWRLVEVLTEQLLIERAERARLEGERRAENGAREVRDALVGKLLEELASLGQAMSAGRGEIPPEFEDCG